MHKHEWGSSDGHVLRGGRVTTLCGLRGTPFHDFELAGRRSEIDCPKCREILSFQEAERPLSVPLPIMVAVA